MLPSKRLKLIALLAGFSAVLQVVPCTIGGAFSYISLVSGLPLYILCRISPCHGIAAYLAVGTALLMSSFTDGLLFFFINGSIGLSFGLLSLAVESKTAMSAVTAALAVIMLFILSSILGISFPCVKSILIFLLLFPFCLLYVSVGSKLYVMLMKKH